MMSARATIESLLAQADVAIGGSRSQDVTVYNEHFFARALGGGSLALGEAYMDGRWDCEHLDEFFVKVLAAKLDEKLPWSPSLILLALKSLLRNRQSLQRAFNIGRAHYDLGNDLFERMLDPRMVYSCAYWEKAQNLAEAQEQKLDLICRKLKLKKGQRLLDIGCGWGSLLKFAAERYGTAGLGITVSKAQAELAHTRLAGYPVEVRLADYRKLARAGERFDAIASIGMFEHVGQKNYRTFFDAVSRMLSQGGLFLLHTIGATITQHNTDPWIDRYIFPGGEIPSVAQIGGALEGHFVMEDWHNFGPDYDKTLMVWYHNFKSAWPELREKYGERFYRMWSYYLLSCAGSFRARRNQLWQIVLSKDGVPGGYHSVR